MASEIVTSMEVPTTTGATLHALFERQAAQSPDAVAVTWGDRALTYRELDARANQLAHYLRHHEVGPGRFVAVCAEPSPERATALLGILKAGGAYLTLDPFVPRERLATLLADAHVPLVLTRARQASRLAQTGQVVLRLDADWGIVADESATPPDVPTALGDPAACYLPDAPSRVSLQAVAHAELARRASGVRQLAGLAPGDRLLQVAGPDGPEVGAEAFPAWLAGAAVVLATGRERWGGSGGLRRLLVEQRVTVLELPAAGRQAWAAELARTGTSMSAHLRLVLVRSAEAPCGRIVVWRSAPDGR